MCARGGGLARRLDATRSTWAGFALPLSLVSIGAPRCDVLVSVDVAVPLTNLRGSATWNVPIPRDVALAGAEVFVQAAVLDHPANALGFAVSNGGAARAASRQGVSESKSGSHSLRWPSARLALERRCDPLLADVEVPNRAVECGVHALVETAQGLNGERGVHELGRLVPQNLYCLLSVAVPDFGRPGRRKGSFETEAGIVLPVDGELWQSHDGLGTPSRSSGGPGARVPRLAPWASGSLQD